MPDNIQYRNFSVRAVGAPLEGEALAAIAQRASLPIPEGAKVYPLAISSDSIDSHASRMSAALMGEFGRQITDTGVNFAFSHDADQQLGKGIVGELRQGTDGKTELIAYTRVLEEARMPNQPQLSVQKALESGEITEFSIGFVANSRTVRVENREILEFHYDTASPEFSKALLWEYSAVARGSNPDTGRRTAKKDIKNVNMKITRQFTVGAKTVEVRAEVKDNEITLTGIEEAATLMQEEAAALKAEAEALKKRAETAEALNEKVLQPDIDTIATLSKELGPVAYAAEEIRTWAPEKIQERAAAFRKARAGASKLNLEPTGEDEKDGNTPTWKHKAKENA